MNVDDGGVHTDEAMTIEVVEAIEAIEARWKPRGEVVTRSGEVVARRGEVGARGGALVVHAGEAPIADASGGARRGSAGATTRRLARGTIDPVVGTASRDIGVRGDGDRDGDGDALDIVVHGDDDGDALDIVVHGDDDGDALDIVVHGDGDELGSVVRAGDDGDAPDIVVRGHGDDDDAADDDGDDEGDGDGHGAADRDSDDHGHRARDGMRGAVYKAPRAHVRAEAPAAGADARDGGDARDGDDEDGASVEALDAREPGAPGDGAMAMAAASRKVRTRTKRTRMRSKTIAMKRVTRAELQRGALMYPPVEGIERPRTRAECREEARPCPWVACKHHLYLDINPETGSIKINFPDLEPWELEHTCSLDVAEAGALTLEEIGFITNLTRERIRQVEVRGLLKLKGRRELR